MCFHKSVPSNRWAHGSAVLPVVVFFVVFVGLHSSPAEEPDLERVLADLKAQQALTENFKLSYTTSSRRHPTCPAPWDPSCDLSPVSVERLQPRAERRIALYFLDVKRRVEMTSLDYLVTSAEGLVQLDEPMEHTSVAVFDGIKTYRLGGGWDAPEADVTISTGDKTGLEGIYTPLSLMCPRNHLPVVEGISSFDSVVWLPGEEKLLGYPCSILELRNEDGARCRLWISVQGTPLILRREAEVGAMRFLAEVEEVDVLDNGFALYSRATLTHFSLKADPPVPFVACTYVVDPGSVVFGILSAADFEVPLGKPGLYFDEDRDITWLQE